MGAELDLLVHYKDDTFKIQNVKPERYKLRDLLDDIIAKGLSNVPGVCRENVSVSYESKIGRRVDKRRIRTEREMKPIFRTKKKEIDLYVELENVGALIAVGDAVSDHLESEVELGEELDGNSLESSLIAGMEIDEDDKDDCISGDESMSSLSGCEIDYHYEAENMSDDEPIARYPNRNKVMVPSNPLKKIKLKKGMLFANVKAFRKALKEYVIREGFEIVREKNEKARVTARCAADGCPWRIHASPSRDGRYMIKTLVAKHNCVRVDKVSEANAAWMAERLVDVLRKNPNMTPREMRNELKRYGISPQYMQLYRAKKKAMETIEGNHKESFSKLTKYAEMVKRTNPGSVVKMQYCMEGDAIPATPTFRKVFMGLHALKSNFLEGCSPFLSFDDCYLEGPFGGVLLAALGIDGNNGLFPLAFAVVDMECKENWGFFVQCLQEMLGGFNPDRQWTFMTDGREGLVEVISELVPHAINRKCCKHIYDNMRQYFPGATVKKLFWRAAKAYNAHDFDDAMLSLKDLNPAAFDWLMNIEVTLWARHAFNLELKIDRVTNDISEFFDHWVGDLTSKPILTLLDGLRSKLMNRIHTRYEKGKKWNSLVTAKVLKKLNDTEAESTNCKLLAASDIQFEVREQDTHYIVNLRERTCSCRAWDVRGVPCRHAALAICHKRESLEMYTDPSFYKDKYLMAYSEKINAVPHPKFWPVMNVEPEVVLPPSFRRLPGRPKKNRKREPGEGARLKILSLLKCSKCGGCGHNKRTCGTGPVSTRKRDSTHIQTSDVSNQEDGDIPLAEFIAAMKRSKRTAKDAEAINGESQGALLIAPAETCDPAPDSILALAEPVSKKDEDDDVPVADDEEQKSNKKRKQKNDAEEAKWEVGLVKIKQYARRRIKEHFVS